MTVTEPTMAELREDSIGSKKLDDEASSLLTTGSFTARNSMLDRE